MSFKGCAHSPEVRAKIAANQRGNKHCLGHKQTPEHRANIAAAKRGVRRPDMVGKRYAWRGGRGREDQGYIRIFSPAHPHARSNGYVLEHRLVMEAHLGRTLLPSEVVHHINGIADDNRIENLARLDSQSEHKQWHWSHQE